jgi:dipeptidyl aminopeptidase/acylaminoacyl peptidase
MQPHDMPVMSPPRYGSPGWIMWPDHPEPSLQFLRTLGAAQDGASTISECFLTAGRIDPADRESWHREWQRIGDINARRADAALAGGNRSTAAASYLRASGYYRASEIYLASADARRVETFAKVASSSRSYLGLTSPAGQAVSIDVGDGTSLDGYLLKPEHGPPRSPAVICFGGLDGSKDELLPGIGRQLRSRGFAVLLIDMPGQGEALRVRGTPIRPDPETPITRSVDFLLEIPGIDGDRIGIYGASLGGVYSARATAFERRIKVAVSNSLVFDLYAGLQHRLASSDPSGWDFLQWTFGCRTADEVLEKSRQLRMASFLGDIRCPYLIVQGEHDFLGLQTAVDAFEFARASGVPVELKVFEADETGASHCQADNPTLGHEYICDWMTAKLGGEEQV